ncbi:RsmE family RNA methyltransferase [Aquirufa sp.]|jgi:16S rRNA (uracil1498-N3)-methyltransferase|uniref:RsmE family RNA methyltransferase n=1 Tax=Aquirufa sp. TaxID=2676249 RepID=UPI0037C08D37
MSKYIFYAPNPTSENRLSEEESFHACRVLRLKSGDPIYLLDGKGAKYAAILINVDSKNTTFGQLTLVEKQEIIPFQIHIYVAPTKQMERMEWMVEKCCEFGIHGIHFFTSRNSERKEIKLNRLEKIAVAALKQSKNLFLPEITPLLPLNSYLEALKDSPETQKLFAHISDPPVKTLSKQLRLNQSYHILIGPEGDFSNDESEKLILHNYIPFSLGKSILRTETACLAATIGVHIAHD